MSVHYHCKTNKIEKIIILLIFVRYDTHKYIFFPKIQFEFKVSINLINNFLRFTIKH